MSLHLFIFYRDIRLFDNTTLIAMSKSLPSTHRIIPVYLLDTSEWKSKNQYQFLLECLDDLDRQLRKEHASRLHVFSKSNFRLFLSKNRGNIARIGWNKPMSPTTRYDSLRRMSIETIELDDAYLVPPDTLQHAPYKKFTPFYNHCRTTYRVQTPRNYRSSRYGTLRWKGLLRLPQLDTNNHFYTHGGYKNALQQLRHAKTLRHYGNTRNIFHIPTSYLSAYLSLNVLSIRQVYHAVKHVSEEFIRQLYWRDFYLYVANCFPKVLANGNKTPLSPKKQREWNNWKRGKTGKPIIDACMRQLNTTGFMHNRGRMLVASYLIKDLKIPFKYGEEYFEATLIDHNVSANNGGWQWVNGSGIDAQPSYQKFNVLIQQKKYDPDLIFVREWIPQYQQLSNDDIYQYYNL